MHSRIEVRIPPAPNAAADLRPEHNEIGCHMSNTAAARPTKVVAIVLAYNCARMLGRANERIPRKWVDDVIVLDDGSRDGTSEVARALGLPVFRHEANRGYGGNVKAGLARAIERGADYVLEVHGDGAQFDPASIEYAMPLLQQGADLVLGSRFLEPGKARQNGMPLVRYLANRSLSFIDRQILGLPLSEFHTGFRVYSRRLVETLPLSACSDNYLFSFQVIAQAAYCGLRIAEVPVQADYRGEHTSHSLPGAAAYAVSTFYELTRFALARRGWSYNPIFPQPGPEAKGTRDECMDNTDG